MINRPKYSKSTIPVLGIFLTLTAFAVSAGVIPPLITTISDEISVDYTSFGSIIMLQFFSFFVAGIFGGWICERHNVNPRMLVLIGLLIVVAMLLAGSALTRLHWFIIWAIPLGFGGGLIETFGSILVSNYEKPNSSKLMNLAQVFFCIGAISAPQIVAVMLYAKIAWAVIFILFGLIILLIASVFFLLTRKEDYAAVPCVQASNNFSAPILKDSLFFLLAAILLIYVTFESLIACWISVYFEKRLFCSVSSSALRLSIYWFGLVFGRLAITVIPRRFTIWPAMFAGLGIMCITSFFAFFTRSPLLVTVLVFLAGFGSGPIWPITVAICRIARNRAKFTSAVIAIGALGVIFGAGLGSVIFRHFRASLFFPFFTSGSIVLLVLSFFVYRRYSDNNF